MKSKEVCYSRSSLSGIPFFFPYCLLFSMYPWWSDNSHQGHQVKFKDQKELLIIIPSLVKKKSGFISSSCYLSLFNLGEAHVILRHPYFPLSLFFPQCDRQSLGGACSLLKHSNTNCNTGACLSFM